MGFAVKGSGNQKNKLNDPGGGSFRYKTLVLCTSSGREKREEKRERVLLSVMDSQHMGAAFHQDNLDDYRLHSQLRP